MLRLNVYKAFIKIGSMIRTCQTQRLLTVNKRWNIDLHKNIKLKHPAWGGLKLKWTAAYASLCIVDRVLFYYGSHKCHTGFTICKLAQKVLINHCVVGENTAI